MRKITTTLLAILSLCACSKVAEKGAVNFTIKSDTNVIEISKSSLSDYATVPSTDNFSLEITDSDKEIVWSGKLSEWHNEYPLINDIYHVVARYGDDSAEGRNLPAFKGETDFEIKGDTKNVEIEAKLTKAIVKLNFTEQFLNYFKDFTFTLTTGAGNNFTITPTTTGSIFVEPLRLTLEGSLTNQGGNTQTLSAQNYTGIQAGVCYTLKFDASTIGGNTITITFNDQTDEVDLGEIELN